jgi:hypothetical protein
MGFWKNDTWRRIEEGATGDPIRGLPKLEYPLKLAEWSYVDRDGDAWISKITCLGMEPAKDERKIQAQLVYSGICSVARKNLEKMGLAPERISSLLAREATEIHVDFGKTIECDAKDLEKIAQKWIEAEQKRNELRYTFNSKQTLIWNKVRATPVSGFSEN